MCIFYVELNAQTKAHLPIDSPLFNFFCIICNRCSYEDPLHSGWGGSFPRIPKSSDPGGPESILSSVVSASSHYHGQESSSSSVGSAWQM